jgi:hypothetical protein
MNHQRHELSITRFIDGFEQGWTMVAAQLADLAEAEAEAEAEAHAMVAA